MKNFEKFFNVLKDQYHEVTSNEVNNCAVRVNAIPLFDNVLDASGHLQSDIELGLRNSSDPEIQDLINSGFYAARPATHNENWSAPAGVKHMTLAQLFDTMQIEDKQPTVAPSSAPASSSDEPASVVTDKDKVTA